MTEDQKEIKKELQQAKEDLRNLERYVEEFSSFLPLGVCMVNPLGIIIDANQAFQDLINYKSIEIVGESLKDIFLEKKEAENLLKGVRRGKAAKTKELTLISGEKKEIPVSVSASAIKDRKGKIIGHFLAFFDVAEIKKFQEELEERVKKRTRELEESRVALMNMLEDIEESRRAAEEEKDKTLAIITNFTDGLLFFDRETNLSLINPRAEDFFKIQSREVIGKSVLELGFSPNLKSLAILLGKPSPLKTGAGREIKEMSKEELLLGKDLILEVSTISIMGGEERTGTLVILHDVTREKTVEKLKTEFVSLSAHQLRTPLSAIKWTLKMLLDGDLGEISKEQREYIEKTYQSNERMIKLINDLLDVTRIEEGRYLYKPALTDLGTVVQSVINSFKDHIRQKGINLVFKKPDKNLPEVKMDVEKMKLAIQNILNNAVIYTHPGGQVTISLEGDKNKVEFRISDNGIGIPKDQQKRVFTKFFRGVNAVKMETGGTGLGLYITKNIIEAHGGKILFKSKEGKGSTFYFSLPCGETT